MPDLPGQDGPAAAADGRLLAELREQAIQARAELASLRQQIIEAENSLSHTDAVLLVEANEQLVERMLLAQIEADKATQALQEATRSAEFDGLTGLPNRMLLLDRCKQAIANARRHKGRLALLFLDLDDFKQVNDTLGHAVGDDVLQLAAQRLAATVRASDTVSRLGGDEFVILLPELLHAADVALIAEKVLAALGEPSRVGEHIHRLRASIGISLFPDDGDDADTLLRSADAAMYRAKRQGLGSFAFHGKVPEGEQQHPATVALPSLRHPVTNYELAMVEYERRHATLREANEQLLRAALSAQQLQTAAEAAQQRQLEFLATLAHELRNPLAPIRQAAVLLGQGELSGAFVRRLQAVIERQVGHMTRLVNDLLDVSRISTGKLRLDCRVVDLLDVIDRAVEACRPAMDLRLQHFSVQMPASEVKVWGDPVRLVQIVGNLISNASKYTDDAGDIALSATLIDDAVAITVSDNGIGITADALPKVFDPFVQDAHAIGFNGAGLGIGLTVVRELVTAHGGTIVAQSAGRGMGSQFIVTLPLTVPPVAPPPV